jgi:hypothetical protein
MVRLVSRLSSLRPSEGRCQKLRKINLKSAACVSAPAYVGSFFVVGFCRVGWRSLWQPPVSESNYGNDGQQQDNGPEIPD